MIKLFQLVFLETIVLIRKVPKRKCKADESSPSLSVCQLSGSSEMTQRHYSHRNNAYPYNLCQCRKVDVAGTPGASTRASTFSEA